MTTITNVLARQIPLEDYALAEAGWQGWVRGREERRRAGQNVWSFQTELDRFRIKQAKGNQPEQE